MNFLLCFVAFTDYVYPIVLPISIYLSINLYNVFLNASECTELLFISYTETLVHHDAALFNKIFEQKKMTAPVGTAVLTMQS